MLFDGHMGKNAKADDASQDNTEKSVFADGQPFFKFGVKDMAKEMYSANLQRSEFHDSSARITTSVLKGRDNDFGLELYQV
jgi:hypothetical protein